ncbi:GFA family protein [Aurantiacibacter odishensis]|uniref:GFA family protein n=1 Tax=Aurantiacibacter odishensis TaxID=1155476 RepID=UPI000E712014|nr:GFA family protein [Aurantiacibacter odishensis]
MSEQREGGCHCGTVRFTVNLPGEPRVRRCNCSICAMKGVVMLDVPRSALEITDGESALTLYTFGTGEAKHRFCSKCGIHPFHQTRSDPDRCGVNLACIDGMTIYDFAEVPVFDGQKHPVDTGKSVRIGTMRFERLVD